MRRLSSDWEQIKKDFSGHKNIIVVPEGTEPPEKYHVTYFVNGIYLLPDGRIETLGRHEVEITLHAEYPRYKPICKIQTPIWHPNFRDGQICIGDIWGAGESLTDIIINIGDMIQYKSWNSSSPLSADAAQWALENKHLFPVGSIDLYIADKNVSENVEIDLFDDENNLSETGVTLEKAKVDETNNINDFEITAEELADVEFIPTVERMQTSASPNGTVKAKVNVKTVLTKGIIWALSGAILGFSVSELSENIFTSSNIARMSGNSHLADYFEYSDKSDEFLAAGMKEFEAYCLENDIPENESTEKLDFWLKNKASNEATQNLENYYDFNEKAEEAGYEAYRYEFSSSESKMKSAVAKVIRTDSAIWSAFVALFIGLFLGIGEGVFYGSKEKAIRYGLIGAGISSVLGYASGYVAQWMYASMLGESPAPIVSALIRGIGWAIMGIGIGLAVGLIKPEIKRLLFCVIGGALGAFLGGFIFNFIGNVVSVAMMSRCVSIIIMGLLIGIGVGLLEQFAKQAWLKVIRGEFEGKEYLVFTGTTSIGNNGKNTIVLFKDKLVGTHHCDIVMEGSRYVVVDCGSPMGTLVNGRRVSKQILKQGDAISVGNSVLVFNTK